MGNLIDINPDEAKKKLSVIRTYHSEILQIILILALIYLFLGQKKSDQEIKIYLNEDRREAYKQLDKNTTIIIDFKQLLIRLDEYHKQEEATREVEYKSHLDNFYKQVDSMEKK